MKSSRRINARLYGSPVLLWLLSGLIITVASSLPMPRQATAENIEQQVLQVIRKHPEIIIESIQNYQRQQFDKQQKARQEFLQEMKANPQGIIGESPTKGSRENKVILVEFSDFQCSYCAQAKEPLQKFVESYRDRVTFVYKHLPLTTVHSEAMSAAKAAWAAGRQGKFWEYHDALFAAQERLGETLYIEIASDLQLNIEHFNRDRSSSAADAAIKKDIALAEKAGIAGTPFLAMNGEIIPGMVQVATLEKVLNLINTSN